MTYVTTSSASSNVHPSAGSQNNERNCQAARQEEEGMLVLLHVAYLRLFFKLVRMPARPVIVLTG